ncbi:MAG: dTDP-4-dehydrorhamnose 3,5-epimerase [Bacteroidia bacterium]
MGFRKVETTVSGVFLIEPDVFGDARGYFLELYNQQSFEAIGLGHLQFVQDNLSYSGKGTLRGLHFQAPPHSQGKLVAPLEGRVLDVVVDIRQDSPTYGQSYCVELDAASRQILYVPEGFAHGFQVLSETCLFFYKCTNNYQRKAEGGIAWDDPHLAIPWRDIPPVLSPKDMLHPRWSDFTTPFV